MITNDPMGIANATRPWDSLDALETVERKRFVLTEMEKRCLNCPYPDDCHQGRCKHRGGKQLKATDEAIRDLHAKGSTDAEIGRMVGMSDGGICYRRKRMGLPANWVGGRRLEVNKT